MYDRATLSNEHAMLSETARQLTALLRSNTPDLAALGTLRWRMSRLLILHLAQEDNFLYPALQRSIDPVTRKLADRLHQEMGELAVAYRAYVARWTGAAIAADWHGFREHSLVIIAALQRRIRREETELYPRIPIAA